jgi:hypothetical protein
MKLQCVRLADYVILNFNNNMSTTAVILDMEKAFDTTWHSVLINKLSELEFSESLIKLIASFLTDRKFKVLVGGEFSAPRIIAARVPQGSVLAPVLCSLYTNDAPMTSGTHLALFVDNTCIFTLLEILTSAHQSTNCMWL